MIKHLAILIATLLFVGLALWPLADDILGRARGDHPDSKRRGR